MFFLLVCSFSKSVMNAERSIKRYERRAHHRLFEIHNLRLKDGESYVDFMDRLIATAGHDWESNSLKCNEIRTAFLQILPTELFWKLNGLHDRDILQLAADADASIHDSRKHAMYQHNASVGSFPNLFSQSQSQSSHGSETRAVRRSAFIRA